jgi:hypothetical protein
MLEQINCLLNQDWSIEEKKMIQRLVDTLLYYKYLIPKNLKQDVISVLDMANVIKQDYAKLQNQVTENLIKDKRRNSI